MGSTLSESIAHAYEVAEKANWPGYQMRKDIGTSS
jgi:phosphoribosylamine-glycine ligase